MGKLYFIGCMCGYTERSGLPARASGCFILIHQPVHPLQNFFHAGMRRLTEQHADADLIKGAGSARTPFPAFLQAVKDLLRYAARADSDEFIPAQTVNSAEIRQDVRTEPGKMLQILIACDMAVSIIDEFKTVQIHKEYGKSLSGFGNRLQIGPKL